MRKRRILSLLLAVAVMATMLVAVPLTASAAVDTSNANVYSSSKTFVFTEEDYKAADPETGIFEHAAKNTETELNNGLRFYSSDKTDDNQASKITKVEVGDEEGYSYRFEGYNGDTGKSCLVFKVAAPGKVTVKAKKKADVTDTRQMRITVGSDYKDFDMTSSLAEYSVDVTGSVEKPTPIYITSRSSKFDVYIYEIRYEVAADAHDTLIKVPETITVYPGSAAAITATMQNFSSNTKIENTNWSIEGSESGVTINETGAYGLVSVDKNVTAPKEVKIKASLTDADAPETVKEATCTVKIETGTPTEKASWTSDGKSAVTANHYLIYNDDVSVNTLFGVSVSSKVDFPEYGLNVSGINVRHSGTDSDLLTEYSGGTVIVVKPKKDIALELKYRRSDNNKDYNYESGNKKDIEIFESSDLSNAIKADTYALSSAESESNGTHYRACASTYSLNADKTYFIGALNRTAVLAEISYSIDGVIGYGKSDTDSGIYYTGNDKVGGTKYGIIRFLQQYTGENVTEYGYYFVDQYGAIVKNVKMSGTETTVTEKGGFSGDLTGIPNENLEDQFYAVPYVCISEGQPVFGPLIGPVTVNQNNWIKASEATATTE